MWCQFVLLEIQNKCLIGDVKILILLDVAEGIYERNVSCFDLLFHMP